MAENLLTAALRIVHRFFEPILIAATDEEMRGALFLKLGWDLEGITNFPHQALNARLAGIAATYNQISELIGRNPDSLDELQEAVDLANQLVDDLSGLGTLFADAGLTPPLNFDEIGTELFTFLQTRYLESYHPFLYRAGVLLTLVELPPTRPTNGQIDEVGNLIRYPHGWPVLKLDRLTGLLSDPLGFLKEEYFDGVLPPTSSVARQITDRLLPRIGLLLEAMGANVIYGFKPAYGIDFGTTGNAIGAGMMTLMLTPGPRDALFGLSIALSAPDQGNLGWVFIPTGTLSYAKRFRDWYMSLNLTAGVQAFAIGLDGRPTLLTDNGATSAQGRIALTYVGNDTENAIDLGNPMGSFLAVQTWIISATLKLDNQSQRYGLAFALGKSLLLLKDLLQVGWDRFEITFLAGTTILLERLRLQTPLFPTFEVEVDLKIGVVNDRLQIDPNHFRLYKPAIAGIVPQNIHLDTSCFAIQWQDDNPDSWLNQLVPDFLAEGASAQSTVTAQVIRGNPIREIRLDWAFAGKSRTIAIPGLIKITTPTQGFFTLLFGAGGRALTRMALGYTITQSQAITFSSNFAWEREVDRELHNDANGQPPAKPLFELKLTAQTGNATLILADFDLSKPTLAGLFLEPDVPLSLLQIDNPTTLCQPVEALRAFSGSGWGASITINYGQLQLPFLKQGENQFIDVFDPRKDPNDNPSDSSLTIDNISLGGANNTIEIPLGLRLKLGDLNIATAFAIEFNWRTLSLHVDHEGGTHLYATKAVLEQDFLGLHWEFSGQLETSGPNQGKYRLFTLVTKNYNYQIQQAPGSVIEISYDGISSDPIVFQVMDFAITDKGLNLRTTVVDAPVRLNGLDTKFRFDGSGIVIENSQIQSFTIAGSGALPPALVGDSRASIALQFGRLNDGNLTLVSGEAKLEGNNLLHCQGTRFQFSVDALGLKFVNDGKFHLYFTITGSAQFVLAGGDDREGALALLPKIKIDLIEAPLTGDVSVIGKHVKFLVELPKPVAFNFLGCFEMELRGIGFEPQAEVFGGDGAMVISGQLKFAQGGGDIIDARIDLHNLHIGLPEQGSFVPRIYFKGLSVSLAISGAFKLNAVVDFIDAENEKGFTGEGMVDIQGLPSMAGAFGFLRVRHNENSPWLRAWFIYLEIRKVSFVIPVVQIYLREVGLGFGYRYTLASIKAVDQEGDIRKLLKELRTLSRTQGDLSKRDRWAVDLEQPGQDPRWTIVLRAMISQTAASTPLSYAEASEKELSCIYLFDAVIAFRSDFTFFMAVRGWFNTNYNDFLTDKEGIRNKPLLSGFVLLAPRQKRFLAHVASNPDGKIGTHPPLPDFVKTAIESAQFSATLLIEPGLLHYEMGWPNMLRWKGKLGPLQVEFQGGFIFRISKTELVTGTSFMARGTIEMEAGISFGVFGVSVSIYAQVAYGARYIGVLAFKDVKENSAFYGAIGLELYIRISIKFWIKLLFIKKSFSFSLSIGFTAALEVGIKGNLEPGLRGQGTVSLKVMGRSIRFGVKIGVNTDAVDEALARTNKFLNIGLESTEVEALPGLSPQEAGTRALPQVGTAFARRTLTLEMRGQRAAEPAPQPALSAPDYTIFTMRLDQERCFFVLIPAGERKAGSTFQTEPGFLPLPLAATEPPTGSQDFQVVFRAPAATTTGTIEQFVPAAARGWQPRPQASEGGEITWQVNWSAAIIPPGDIEGDYTTNDRDKDDIPVGKPGSRTTPVQLHEYIAEAFVQENGVPVADPRLIPEDSTRTEDERVYNPTDSAFESAVRGAFEQFNGSPFFKFDPNLTYDRALKEAFDQETNIYAGEGEARKKEEQADQVRGLILHDLVADLQTYVDLIRAAEANPSADNTARIQEFEQRSIAFQMGLVFKVTGARPAWLDVLGLADDQLPQISQRMGAESTAPHGEPHTVRPFNTPHTSFKFNPPRFDRVRHYTNATTVGITWDLIWDELPGAGCTPSQAEPEQHLLHYEVRRRALDSQARDLVFTVRSGEVLHRATGGSSVVERLRPRFQLVDNFTDLTAAALARLPAQGLSYLYTITPVDIAKNRGRPLTIVATRYPDAPPLVPANGELTVTYRLSRPATLPISLAEPTIPAVIAPETLQIHWTEPRPRSDGADVPIYTHQLIFRREETLPIGSYGLDSSTQREKVKALPTTNARTRPTDIVVTIVPSAIQFVSVPAGVEGANHDRVAEIPLQTLRDQGIFPTTTDARWRPEAWRLFFRTISTGGVPSALAPVQLKVRVLSALPETPAFKPLPEERRPAELEWLPTPIRLPLLPPEDQKATTGDAHFPMPQVNSTVMTEDKAAAWRFTGDVKTIQYQLHPAGLRAIRFRWNQGPSHQPAYPLNLSAGYDLLELDLDAHTNVTLSEPTRLSAALRPIQEVQMLPADDLTLIPSNTLITNQWEAWYLSTQVRRNLRTASRQDAVIDGSETAFSPWFSWRESLLVWPAWKVLEEGRRNTTLHPFLAALVDILQITADDPPQVQGKYIVDQQGFPPIQPMTFSDFRRTTAPTADPYGWGVLQRFGLSLALSLRRDGSGELVTGQPFLGAIQQGLSAALTKYTAATGDATLAKHIHVELLFQPGESVSLQAGQALDTDLLGFVQLSLRPVPIQYLRYSAIQLSGPAGADLELVINLVSESCTLIEQANVAGRGQQAQPKPEEKAIELKAEGEPIIHRITLPLNGSTQVLLRSRELFATGLQANRIGIRLPLANPLDAATINQLGNYPVVYVKKNDTQAYLILQAGLSSTQRGTLRTLLGEANYASVDKVAAIVLQPPTEFEPTAEYATYFLAPVAPLIAAISQNDTSEQAKQWLRFKRYAESLNSSGRDEGAPTGEPRIVVPTTATELSDDNLLAQYLSWSQRFFDHSGPVRSLRAANVSSDKLLAAQLDGPWLATAYPRAGTPAYATPDAAGRLQYIHLLEDKWAHNYRYYIRPYGRYQQLWRNLYLSPLLWPEQAEIDQEAIAPALPKLAAGGLDVVLDRTKLVDMPTILRSGRLDPMNVPGKPAEPGKLWEVIIAQHREQALSERNQTVYRQLAFRQVAYTLVRRFAYQTAWRQWQNAFAVKLPYEVAYPENLAADLPNQLEPTFYALDDPAAIAEADLLRFALPRRLDAFQQGALVVQWEALPFYYEHRMLVIAQTATQVSPVNAVVQQDFEYRAPEPADEPETDRFCANFLEGGDAAALRIVEIPLRRLWDSLPPTVQLRWPDEHPALTGTQSAGRRPGLLPDPEVVYQIIEYFQGNIEVQAELYVNQALTGYETRQLGKRQLAAVMELRTPDGGETYHLRVSLQQGDEAGVIHWTNETTLATLQNPNLPNFTFTPLDHCRLVWFGAMSAAEETALTSLVVDEQLKLGLLRLAAAARQVVEDGKAPLPITTAVVPLGPEQPRQNLPAGWHYTNFQLSGLPQGATLRLLEAAPPAAPAAKSAPPFVTLRWTGLIFASEQAALLTGLLAWAQLPELQQALGTLFATLAARTVAMPYAGELPSGLSGVLLPQLQATAGELRFTGLLQDAAQWQALLGLATAAAPFADAFKQAVTALTQQFTTTPVDIALNLPKRPAQADLPDALRQKLVVGRALLRFTGPMRVATAQAAQAALREAAEQKAIAYLYEQSIQTGLTGRTLRIRTRRGSAPPSQMRDLEPMRLDQTIVKPVEGETA